MKKSVKIALALLAALTMLISLAACGGTESKHEPGATTAPSGEIGTEAPGTEAPETNATETEAPESEASATEPPEKKEPGAEDGQNPVMNFIGVYYADRCVITVGAKGDSDAVVKVSWGASADTAAEYTMSGAFEIDTMRINYSDCEKKFVRYDADGSVVEESVEYTDGVGRIQFFDDGTLQWMDEHEAEDLAGMIFTFGS